MAKQTIIHETIENLQALNKATGYLREISGEHIRRVLITDNAGEAIPDLNEKVKWLLELNRERDRVVKQIMNYKKKK